MGLTIKYADGNSTATITALEEVWADKDGKPVPYGDERGKSVLVGKGSQIGIEDAVKAGLIPDPAKAEEAQEKEDEGEESPVNVPPPLPVEGPPVTKKATK